MAIATGKVRVELIGLDRGPSNTVVVRIRLVNGGSEPFYPESVLDWPAADGVHAAEPSTTQARGITLVDTAGGKRYFPLIGAGGGCLCSETLNSIVQPGGSAEFYAVVPAPPPEVKRISVSVPQTRVFPDVPIGEGPVRPPGGTDPAGAGRPKILPLISTAEGGDRAVDDGDATRSVRLSSDVLFAVDRADLSAKAQAVLADVARQIDRAAGATVRIDGHTDDTGDDAINDPLSLRRAESVQRALAALVSRQGVDYRSAGHGSKEPIAGNTSDEGRRRNRRVTVTFSKPPAARPDGGSRPGAPTNPMSPPRPKAPEVRSLKLGVTELRRSPSGLVNLVWKLTNTGGEQFSSTTQFTIPVTKVFYYGGASDGTMGVTLYDEATGMRYYTLRDTQNRCVCNQPVGRDYRVLPGGTMTHANAYRLPPEVTDITVEFPGYEPTRNVPVS
ncbi:OmpA family protein [Actinomadura madurae]|uniref:OmpA family protein n=1 Tax=Actinomadura madurae TaxID=1993 RepID=UPI0020268AA6|nr:OmpA family protein [Actinomadura madurae]URM98087.1 OmpA family protein [Actinomadura madurae]